MPASCACFDAIHSPLVRIRGSGNTPSVASLSHSSAARAQEGAEVLSLPSPELVVMDQTL
jgi:hypothetical protein